MISCIACVYFPLKLLVVTCVTFCCSARPGTYFYQRGVKGVLQQQQHNNLTEGDNIDPSSEADLQEEDKIFLGADGRSTSAASSAQSQKFLNSGCILGKELYVFIVRCRCCLDV